MARPLPRLLRPQEAAGPAAAGLDVHLPESSGSVDGRVTGEHLDGFVVDRGFQVLDTGCPRALDPDLLALRLGFVERGAVLPVRPGRDGQRRTGGPRRPEPAPAAPGWRPAHRSTGIGWQP